MAPPWTDRLSAGGVRDARADRGVLGVVLYVVVFLGGLFVCRLLLTRLGMPTFLAALVLAFVGLAYFYISFRSLTIPYAFWLFCVGGFRFLWTVRAPGLPDIYLDRVAMIWLVLVFVIKLAAERRRLRSPFTLDVLILVHGLYILVRIIMNKNSHFHDWTMSYLIPYTSYYMAKNIITNGRLLRMLLFWLLLLSVYYSITSIAEKFRITPLVWPKSILTAQTPWGGRSNGPFQHAPLFGTTMGMMLPIYLYFLATVRNRVAKGLLYFLFAIALAGLYFSYTRGSWLAGVLALAVAVALNRRQYLRIAAPALVLLPLLAVMVLGVGQDKFMKERVGSENTIESRVGVAMTALRMWKEHPFLGVGFFEYRYRMQDYVRRVDVPFLGSIHMAGFRHVPIHDIYLGPLAEDGLVGAVLQAWIYLLILRAFLRKNRLRREGDRFAVFIMPVFAGLMVGYLVGGIAIDYRFFSIVGTLFYSAAGILYGYDPRTDSSDELVPEPTAAPRAVHLRATA